MSICIDVHSTFFTLGSQMPAYLIYVIYIDVYIAFDDNYCDEYWSVSYCTWWFSLLVAKWMLMSMFERNEMQRSLIELKSNDSALTCEYMFTGILQTFDERWIDCSCDRDKMNNFDFLVFRTSHVLTCIQRLDTIPSCSEHSSTYLIHIMFQ